MPPTLLPARLPGESARVHGYLVEYCRLGPQRTLVELSRRFNRGVQNFSNHSRRWDWTSRAAAYDLAVQREDDRIFLEERQSAERLRQRRQLEARQVCWELGQAIVAVAKQMLEVAGGGEWDYADLARLCLVAEKLSRAATEPFSASVAEQRSETRIAGTFRLWADGNTDSEQTDPPRELLLEDGMAA